MKTYFIEDEFCYTGRELRSLYAYQTHEVLGDSIISWIGSCDVAKEYMVDGEDLLADNEITAEKMVHFIVEKFNANLFSAVALQRLMSSLCVELLKKMSSKTEITSFLDRRGDDIYFENQKLNISIATNSPSSALIHFAVNVTNAGTPIPTLCLEDLGVDPKRFSIELMGAVTAEVESMERATQKVKWVR